MKNFHFTLGPVQSFVEQARRTRDLWAGSFLLSWLSGQAMKSLLKQNSNNTIVFPVVVENGIPIDPMLKAIMTGQHNHPRIGSIPNRFKAVVMEDFDPGLVVSDVQEKWQQLTNAVFERFVKGVVEKQGRYAAIRGIWDRQIDHFWEINWVLGDDPGDRSDDHWLDIRKNWRSQWPKAEEGNHCTIMAGYQELSGYIRTKEKNEQEEFWNDIRGSKELDGYLDIREHERLCAIALVKRLFPKLGKNELERTIGWVPGKVEAAVGNWPSTTYMAVAPWLRHIAEDSRRIDLLEQYLNLVKDTVGNGYFKKLAAERPTNLAMLKPLQSRIITNDWELDAADGDILHIHALKNYRSTYLSDKPLTADGKDNNEEKRQTLIDALSKFYGTDEVNKIPRSYYALLLMDGDHLGKMLREKDPQAVSRALLAFTRGVHHCVDELEEHSGVTIYAGGDDVLALLPMDHAISCAQSLRRLFGECFEKEGIKATASCAIVFAHHQVPLRLVLQEAHHQLEDIAKGANGRDSLALSVFKPGGVLSQWASVWEEKYSPVQKLQELVQSIADNNYSRGFFHKLDDRYGIYGTSDCDIAPTEADIHKLLVAEYMHSRDKTPTLAEAEAATERLQAACNPLRRTPSGTVLLSTGLQLDGGFIARFLTQEQD